MSKTVDDLITRHYAAVVMGQGDRKQVIADLQVAAEDPAIAAEMRERLDQIDKNVAARGDISQHDFCGHIERIALRLALLQEQDI